MHTEECRTRSQGPLGVGEHPAPIPSSLHHMCVAIYSHTWGAHGQEVRKDKDEDEREVSFTIEKLTSREGPGSAL